MRGFILGVLLLTLIGWCVVHETVKQTKARYRLAEAARHEADVLRRLEKLRAEEESLLQPARLAKLTRELKLDVVSLASTPPPVAAARRGAASANRLPGEFDRDMPDTRLAAMSKR